MTRTEARERVVALREQMRDDYEAMSRLHENAEGRGMRSSEREEYDRRDARFQRNQREVEQLEREHGMSRGNGAVRARHAAEAAEGERRIEAEGDGVPRRTRAAVTLGCEQRMSDWYRSRGVRSDYAGAEEDFSLGRAVRGMISGRWNDADLERRALGEGVSATGGALVPEVLAATVIDRIRNRARVLEAGATTVPLESDEYSIPRLATGVQGAWRNEHAPVSEEQPSFERVTFRAKTLAVLVKMSYELAEDLRPESADIIEHELVQALGLELDRVALRGSGVSPEPLGVRNQTGVAIQSMGTNGASLTNYAPLIDAVAAVQGANMTPNAAIYSSRTARELGGLVDTTGQPLNPPRYLDGLTHLVSNQVPDDLTAGTSTDTSEVYVGEWPNLLVGVRPQVGVRVQKLSEAFASTMEIGLLCCSAETSRSRIRADSPSSPASVHSDVTRPVQRQPFGVGPKWGRPVHLNPSGGAAPIHFRQKGGAVYVRTGIGRRERSFPRHQEGPGRDAQALEAGPGRPFGAPPFLPA